MKAHDIVNLRMAEAADARCLLVGDIDRGGVFASLLGTLELLDPHERARIHAFVINKFRGDRALLEPGVTMIERRIARPCAGVVPWLTDVGLDEEDGAAAAETPRVARCGWRGDPSPARPLRVAVVALPYLANATDFAALAAEPSVELAYADRAGELADADLVILPGTKSTLADLRWLRARGLADELVAFARTRPVVGICGGMQMLGTRVSDPHGVEGGGALDGLGLLALTTELAREKVTQRVRVRPCDGAFFGVPFTTRVAGNGYEIHLGRSQRGPGAAAFAQVERDDGTSLADGALSSDRRVVGTYVHGLFADDAVRHALIHAARMIRGLAASAELRRPLAAERDARFDRLAAHVRASLRLELLLA